jgi:hypothetical protein
LRRRRRRCTRIRGGEEPLRVSSSSKSKNPRSGVLKKNFGFFHVYSCTDLLGKISLSLIFQFPRSVSISIGGRVFFCSVFGFPCMFTIVQY